MERYFVVNNFLSLRLKEPKTFKRFCMYCGAQLDFNTKFCPNCGQKV